MPFLLESDPSVVDLVALHVPQDGGGLHSAGSLAAALSHLHDCPHDVVLVSGRTIVGNGWDDLLAEVPDDSRVILWSSHPEARRPRAPHGRRVQGELIVGTPSAARLASRLTTTTLAA